GNQGQRARGGSSGGPRPHFDGVAPAEGGLERQGQVPFSRARGGGDHLAGARLEGQVFARRVARHVARRHVKAHAWIVGVDPLAVGGDDDLRRRTSSERN